MGSKHLESIMANIPPATVSKEVKPEEKKELETVLTKVEFPRRPEKIVRVVATVDKSIKQELRETALKMDTTETVIILRALKNFGFKSIDDSMLVDRRTTR